MVIEATLRSTHAVQAQVNHKAQVDVHVIHTALDTFISKCMSKTGIALYSV